MICAQVSFFILLSDKNVHAANLDGQAVAALGDALLAVYGGVDQNVPTNPAVAALTHLREVADKDIEIRVYPGRNHYFFKWYNVLTVGMPSDYFDLIGDWAAEQVD